MMRSNTRSPGSTLIISGSARVRSLARKASYLTSFTSGLAAALAFAMPAIDPFAMPAVDAFAETGVAPPCAAGWAIPPPFFSSVNIWSGGVKLKSASMTTISCWSGRSRWSRMISGAAISSCSCSPWCECIHKVPPKRSGKS